MSFVGYIGYAKCDNCSVYSYINNPGDIKIWYHPDDEGVLAEVKCHACGDIVISKVPHDHMRNFKRRGCKILSFNDRYEPFTEKDIDDWDIDADFAASF